MDVRSKVGVNIRKIRNGQKLSQEELAHEAEIDRAYLSEVENGRKNVGVVVLARLAAALKVKITAFFEGYK